METGYPIKNAPEIS